MNSFERLYFAPDERRVCFCCCFGQNPVPAQQRMREIGRIRKGIRMHRTLIADNTPAGHGGSPMEADNTTDHHDGNQIRLLSFIYDHYMEDISVQDLSAHMGYSEVHTSWLFKQYFGQTFVSYLAHYRMRKAAHLLLYTDMTVKEIGSAVGYSNPNYFGRVFHRIYEMTPTEYREQKRD
jgi:AraC-like DNA-binding protein